MTLRRWFAGLVGVSLLGFPLAVFAQLEAVDEARAEEAVAEEAVIEEDAVADEVVEGIFETVQRVIRPRPARPPGADPFGGPDAPATEPEDKPAEEKEEEKEEPETPRTPKAPLPPRFMLLKLQDGSLIAGDLSVNEITVTTEFGELTVPIAKIKSFTPGLDSNTKAGEELKGKLKDLESDDYNTREQARKDLAAMGPKIAQQLTPHLNSENVEVKRHVTEILKEFEQQAEETSEDEEGGASNKPWIDEDTIETTNFTVTGKISPAEFRMASKYGPLTIALGEIVSASRPTDSRESIRRTVSVPGQNLVQRGFKQTGVRVQAGDRVTITASGNITMTPWGGNSASGPDGMPNYGWYVNGSIPGGALVYRIGDKGQIQKAGTRVTFTAKTSGTLQLAIGMMAEYGNEGYNFPGEYKAKVKVDPK